jgi:dipeptidyl aminopeptidase/acylaminoacyl peptidase
LLVIHPSADQRVPPEHYYKYVKALEKAGIPHKSLLLDGADHFYTTLFYNHKSALYESILDFLAHDCGLENVSKEVAASN